MEHFVTLFDRAFAPQGLALHRSLLRHARDFTLWILCIDREVEDLLASLELANVRLLSLSDIESERLLSVKGDRTRGEYCWTLTPFTFDAVFDADATVERVTYLDADVWLLRDPTPTFRRFERSGAAVQITEHAYAPDHDQTATSGRYCVQFLTMTRDGSEPVRRWWQQRCIEWCYARVEDGKFGDQKYLDDWPERFGALVHVAEPKSAFQGPWNMNRYPYSEGALYHFHGLRMNPDQTVRLAPGGYSIPEPHLKNVYAPYLGEIARANLDLGNSLNNDSVSTPPPNAQLILLRNGIRAAAVRVIRKVLGLPAVTPQRSTDAVPLPPPQGSTGEHNRD